MFGVSVLLRVSAGAGGLLAGDEETSVGRAATSVLERKVVCRSHAIDTEDKGSPSGAGEPQCRANTGMVVDRLTPSSASSL